MTPDKSLVYLFEILFSTFWNVKLGETRIISGQIDTPDGWTGFLVSARNQSGGFQLDIDYLTFNLKNERKCTIGTVLMRWYLYDDHDISENYLTCGNISQDSMPENVIAKTYFPMECFQTREEECFCRKVLVIPSVARPSNLYIGFDGCEFRRSIEFNYSINFRYLSYKCVVPHETFPCKVAGVVDKYMRDNETDRESVHFLTDYDVNMFVTDLITKKDISCYQYSVDVLCRFKYPSCPGEKTRNICQEVCYDFVKGCNTLISKLGLVPDLGGLCPLFLSKQRQDVFCWDKKVDCGEPPGVSNALYTIHRYERRYFVEYVCEDNYYIKGGSQVNCTLSGKWNKSVPVCVKKKTIPVTTIVISSIAVLLLNIMFVALLVYRKEVLAVMYVRIGCTIGRRFENPMPYAAYIISEGDEADLFVDTILLPALEEKHCLNVLANIRDGLLGIPLQEDCYNDMKKCSRAVFVVNNDFLECPSLLHLFQQAEEFEKRQKGFRVVILMNKVSKKTDIGNKALAAYIKTGCFLSPHKRFFMDRLLYSLPRPQVRRIRATASGAQDPEDNASISPLLPEQE